MESYFHKVEGGLCHIYTKKPDKRTQGEPKSFSSINLASFLLETKEKLIAKHIKDKVLNSLKC